MRIFVICPVRAADLETTAAIEEEVAKLEGMGHGVYWPARDTDQDDPYGNRICGDNRRAIEQADEVMIWWDPASQGSLFDLGIAWGLRKRIGLLNRVEKTERNLVEPSCPVFSSVCFLQIISANQL